MPRKARPIQLETTREKHDGTWLVFNEGYTVKMTRYKATGAFARLTWGDGTATELIAEKNFYHRHLVKAWATAEANKHFEKNSTQEPIAESIRAISAGMKKLGASGLNRDAILILLTAKTGVGKKMCEKVIEGLDQLAETYSKKTNE